MTRGEQDLATPKKFSAALSKKQWAHNFKYLFYCFWMGATDFCSEICQLSMISKEKEASQCTIVTCRLGMQVR